MFDDFKTYYYVNVVSSFNEYRTLCKDKEVGCSRDLRKALIAASAIFHLREHIPNSPLKRSDVEQLCPDYALLGDVVNATKHKVLTSQTPHGQSLVK